MSLLHLSVQLLYTSSTLFALGLMIVLWQNRDETGATPLVVGTVGASVWSFCLLLSTLPWESVAVLSIRVMYLGVGIAVAGAFLVALEYTGRERYITRPLVALLSIHPPLVLVVALVNPEGLFFRSLDPASGISVVQEWGIAFWIHSAYSYVLMMFAIGMILELILKSNRTLYRGQAISLLLAVAFPTVFNTVFTTGIVEVDTTPIGFIGLSASLTFAILRYEFVNLFPIAREKVIENVRDGMLVLDADGYIIDSNPAVERLFGLETSPVGDHAIRDILAGLPELQNEFDEITDGESSDSRTITYGGRYFNVDTTPLRDDKDSHVGWLLLIEDVTERVRRERDLEQQIDKLDQFAELVSHDLRNPLNVGRLYVQQSRATGELENLEKIEDSLDRMETIIDDVLALTREGQDVTEPRPTNLGNVASNAWENVDTRDASLEITDEASAAMILADESRLQRLFENLFRNSIEHGTADDAGEDTALQVTVDVRDARGSSLSIYIADNGVGIPSDQRDRVFEDGFSTRQAGTGLGLSIVDQIATGHGWDVGVQASEAGGAAFKISGVGKPIRAAQVE